LGYFSQLEWPVIDVGAFGDFQIGVFILTDIVFPALPFLIFLMKSA
jgi:hypothetical protein